MVGDAVARLFEIDNETVDMVLFSPPYGDIRTYEGSNGRIDWHALAHELLRVTVDGGFCAIVVGDSTENKRKTLTPFRIALIFEEAGWSCFEVCIYARDGRPGGWWKTRFRVDHEYILLMFKGERPRELVKDHIRVPTKHPGARWKGTARATDGSLVPIKLTSGNDTTKCRGTIWRYRTSNFEQNKVKMEHPATFPDDLAKDLILMATSPGDMVLDPMCGSGTTCVVARQQKRKFIGIDLSRNYIGIAKRRLNSEV